MGSKIGRKMYCPAWEGWATPWGARLARVFLRGYLVQAIEET
jgi:hypothetical protein